MSEKVKLGDVCKVQGGYAFKSKQFQKNKIPIVRIGNIQDNQVKIDYSVCYTEEFLNMHPEFEIQGGDILIAMSGATVGKIGKYKNDKKALLNQRVGNFITTEKLEKGYLYFLLQSPLFEKYILNNAFGCAQPNISSQKIEEFEFYLYDNKEQMEITNQLDKIQKIVDIRKKQIEQLDELIKSQFVEMFGMPLENSKNWKVELADDICLKITDGSHFSPKDIGKGYAMLSVKNMRNDGFHYENCKHVSKESFEILKNQKCVPEINDVLISKDGSYFYYGFVVKENKEEAVLSSIAILKPDIKTVNPTFLCNYMLSESIVKYVSDHYVTGAALKRVILKGIKKIPVMVPPIELQNKFAEFVKQIDKQKFEVQKSLEEIQKLQESLMNKYFNGEVKNG